MTKINNSELVLHQDGSVYHLNLHPGELAETILLVGDPARSTIISTFFDSIELHRHNREIVTYTGYYKGKRISVMSTGMGTDNIEIVVNEIDALFNIDFTHKVAKEQTKSVNLIRLGTSGALQKDIPVVDSYLVSASAIGLDGLAYFYADADKAINTRMTDRFLSLVKPEAHQPRPYGVEASPELLLKLGYGWRQGVTLTAPGFYGPQGRVLRLPVKDQHFIERASQFSWNGHEISNFEMETSALYFLSLMLGHKALTVCDIIANRVNNEFNPNYKKSMNHLIVEMLERVSVL
jgi:uridine phosphorylase